MKEWWPYYVPPVQAHQGLHRLEWAIGIERKEILEIVDRDFRRSLLWAMLTQQVWTPPRLWL